MTFPLGNGGGAKNDMSPLFNQLPLVDQTRGHAPMSVTTLWWRIGGSFTTTVVAPFPAMTTDINWQLDQCIISSPRFGSKFIYNHWMLVFYDLHQRPSMAQPLEHRRSVWVSKRSIICKRPWLWSKVVPVKGKSAGLWDPKIGETKPRQAWHMDSPVKAVNKSFHAEFKGVFVGLSMHQQSVVKVLGRCLMILLDFDRGKKVTGNQWKPSYFGIFRVKPVL